MFRRWKQAWQVAELKKKRNRKESLIKREIHDPEELAVALSRVKEEYLKALDHILALHG